MAEVEKTFYLRAYGCQMNQYDAGVVARIMAQAGYEPVPEPARASIVLLLTCSVRRHAEQRALGRLASLKPRNGRKAVAILGCMAQRLGKELVDWGADIVVGPDEYEKLPCLIEEYLATKVPQVATQLTRTCYEELLPFPSSGVVASIVIMRGCDNYCSYCVVPYLRGRERSRNYRSILIEAEKLRDAGVKELSLVGQNVLAYESQGVDFARLLAMLDRLEGIERLRFITAHPRDLSPELIRRLSQIPKLCESFHLPVQSGSNRILNLMNRGYTREEYLARIETLRSAIPGAAISTDLIVGFPTETATDFDATLRLVEEVSFDSAYIYLYSPRPETKAAQYPKVEPEVAQERLQRLISVQNRITRHQVLKLVGQVVEILVEGPAPRDGSRGWGRTRTDKGVVFSGPIRPGELLKVRIGSVSGWTAQGVVVDS